MAMPEEARPPFPPFSKETALRKVRLAEDAWNSRNPEKVALAYPGRGPEISLASGSATG